MKKLIYGTLFLALVGIGLISCKKAEINKTENQSSIELNTKEAPLVPKIRHFECGEPISGYPYPCPNANCDFMGDNCLPTVYIYSDRKGYYDGNYEEYLEAVDILDYYIFVGNTPNFFENYVDEYLMLMPYLGDPERYPILDDLKSGYTSVRKHPKTIASEEVVNIYEIFVVETGEPPVYE